MIDGWTACCVVFQPRLTCIVSPFPRQTKSSLSQDEEKLLQEERSHLQEESGRLAEKLDSCSQALADLETKLSSSEDAVKLAQVFGFPCLLTLVHVAGAVVPILPGRNI